MEDTSPVGPIRPPSEAHSLLIRVTKNCPWNRCAFCTVFKERKFKLRPLEEIKAQILFEKKMLENAGKWAKETGYSLGYVARYNGIMWIQDDGVKSAFLQDSDSLVMKTESLVEILTFLCETFPTIEKICTYARGRTVYRKKPGELRALRDAGLSRLHIGLETGDDELLSYIAKGATAAQMIEAGKKAMEAGFEVSEYVMPGLGGVERCEQHAVNTARVLNEIDPHFIRLRTFHLVPGSLMYERAKEGAFHMQSVEGVLLEVRQFVEELAVTSQLITSDYAHNYYLGEIDGKLPQDKERLLQSIDEALTQWRSRGEPRRNPFSGGLDSDRP